MRTVVACLALLGVLTLALSVALALRAQDSRRHSVTANGVVTALNEGPYHAEVSVTGADGRRFDYVEDSSERPLAVGQTIAVRYLPSAPEQTARIARGGADLPVELAIMGALMILAALLSPLLVRRFPGVLASPIRP